MLLLIFMLLSILIFDLINFLILILRVRNQFIFIF